MWCGVVRTCDLVWRSVVFQDDAGQNSEQYDEAVQAFNAYTEQVKVLAQQVAEFKLAAGEAYRKVRWCVH